MSIATVVTAKICQVDIPIMLLSRSVSSRTFFPLANHDEVPDLNDNPWPIDQSRKSVARDNGIHVSQFSFPLTNCNNPKQIRPLNSNGRVHALNDRSSIDLNHESEANPSTLTIL
uniref:Uncharacterized protein n=1 Tax=uncultured marine group II/III euryarchaeote KM3_85_D04 TaxID=1456527 RepID=A0A075HRT3_9EURY|nr:hypothetical protein [uncultured marine group II/III euryarchaeote KM3_85_D04]